MNQIIITRHFPNEKNGTDMTYPIKQEAHQPARDLGNYIAQHYLQGETAITAVNSGMERSRESIDFVAQGTKLPYDTQANRALAKFKLKLFLL